LGGDIRTERLKVESNGRTMRDVCPKPHPSAVQSWQELTSQTLSCEK